MEAADSVVQEVGWPFLVSAGLVRDYTVLVAPDFLVADGEQGLLGIAGGAVDGGPIECRTVRTSSGRLLALSYAARLLTSAAKSGSPVPSPAVRAIRPTLVGFRSPMIAPMRWRSPRSSMRRDTPT